MTVFPQGSTHTEWNPDCTDAVFVAGFNSDDPGVKQDAQTTFGLSDEVMEAILGSRTASSRAWTWVSGCFLALVIVANFMQRPSDP